MLWKHRTQPIHRRTSATFRDVYLKKRPDNIPFSRGICVGRILFHIPWTTALRALCRESEEEYSDDDDMSWKVRRAAAKCLEAVIATRHEMLDEFYRTVSPALIARFKEREENVKVDILQAYVALLRQTKPLLAQQQTLTPADLANAEGTLALVAAQVRVPNESGPELPCSRLCPPLS